MTQGELTISSDVTITGPGQSQLTISGDATGNGASIDDSRVLNVTSGTVQLRDLTVSGGYPYSAGYVSIDTMVERASKSPAERT